MIRNLGDGQEIHGEGLGDGKDQQGRANSVGGPNQVD